jgi:hypothetical protein
VISASPKNKIDAHFPALQVHHVVVTVVASPVKPVTTVEKDKHNGLENGRFSTAHWSKYAKQLSINQGLKINGNWLSVGVEPVYGQLHWKHN